MKPLCTTINHTFTFICKLPEIRGKDRGGDDCAGHDAFQVVVGTREGLGVKKANVQDDVEDIHTGEHVDFKGLWPYTHAMSKTVMGSPGHVRPLVSSYGDCGHEKLYAEGRVSSEEN